MPYFTKKQMVRHAHDLLTDDGYEISRSLINRAFTYRGKPGNRRGSRQLFGCLMNLGSREIILALKKRGVIFEGNRAVGIGPLPPRQLELIPSEQSEEDENERCPHCGAPDPLRDQASRCPHCDQPVE